MLKITVTVKTNEGKTRSIERLFNLNGEAGYLNPAMVAIIALSMSLFGFTLVSTRMAFGPIGVVTLVAALAITTMGVQVWYLKLIQAVIVILLVFVFLTYRYENRGVT